MNKERIVFLGTPELAAESLKALLDHGFNIVGVVSQPDAFVGRSHTLIPSPVSKVALAHSIPLHRPEKLNKDYQFIVDLHPDLLLTFAFGQILSSKVLALSKTFKPLNVHPSPLPLLRGAAPIQGALLMGLSETAVDLMEMVKAMDAGQVYYSEKVAILPKDNATTLTEKISQVAQKVLVEQLPNYFANKLIGVPQDESKVTLCHMFHLEATNLKPTMTGEEFVNTIRAFAMKPGAYVLLNSQEKIKIYAGEFLPNNSIPEEKIGSLLVTKKDLLIALSDGYVRPLLLQREGKKMMELKPFLNGARNLDGLKIIPDAKKE